MATNPDHLYKMPRMHKTFAISSICLALSFFWMLGADYYREWRRYQSEFTKIDVKKTEAAAEASLHEVDESKLKGTQEALGAAKADLEAKKAELRGAERELSRKDAVRYRIDLDYRFAKATVDSLRYDFESKRAEEDPRQTGVKAELDRMVAKMDESRQKLLVAEQEVKAVKDRIAAMTAARGAAQKQQGDLLALHDRLVKKVQKSKPNLWKRWGTGVGVGAPGRATALMPPSRGAARRCGAEKRP